MKQQSLCRLALFSFLASCILVVASAGPREQELLAAIENDDWKTVSRLLENGVPHTFEDEQTENTPLMRAVGQLNTGMIKLLINHGAKPDFRTKRGDSALHSAAYSGSAAVWKTMLAAKPNVNITNGSGGTPLMVASFIGNAPAVKLLLNAKAQVDAQMPDGNTALILAASGEEREKQRNETALLLLKAKADPNHRNKENRNALYYTVLNENEKIVKTLLQHGAKFDKDARPDQEIWTSATEAENSAIISSLVAASKSESKTNDERR